MKNISHTNKNYSLFYIQSGILLFFSFWFFIAFLTNLFDLLNNLGLINQWKFSSGNYASLQKVISIYSTPKIILTALFYSDISAQLLSSILFLVAFVQFLRKTNPWPYINVAFGISMALWAIFLIMEEIFISYSYEATHIRLLILEIMALIFLHILPTENLNIRSD